MPAFINMSIKYDAEDYMIFKRRKGMVKIDKLYPISIAVIVLLGFNCFVGSFSALAIPTPQPINTHLVVCIGDSITFGQPNPNNWPYLLNTRLGANWTIVNQGIGGDMTSNMLSRINKATALHPHYVIIAGGTNDLLNWWGLFFSFQKTESNLQTMCDRVVANGGTPVLCTIIPTRYNFAQQQTLNAWIKSYAQLKRYPVIDFYAVMNNPKHPGYPNPSLYESSGVAAGIHPNAAGYTTMANSIDLGIFRN